jgi:hypothetical protein
VLRLPNGNRNRDGDVTTSEDDHALEATIMGERVLRGSRLGSSSYETDRNTDLAPRQEVTYDCPRGHVVTVPMAAEADLPATWECKVCGGVGLLRDGTVPDAKKTKPQRTHWDMLLERRSLDDLEEVLQERLALLHSNHRKSA